MINNWSFKFKSGPFDVEIELNDDNRYVATLNERVFIYGDDYKAIVAKVKRYIREG